MFLNKSESKELTKCLIPKSRARVPPNGQATVSLFFAAGSWPHRWHACSSHWNAWVCHPSLGSWFQLPAHAGSGRHGRRLSLLDSCHQLGSLHFFFSWPWYLPWLPGLLFDPLLAFCIWGLKQKAEGSFSPSLLLSLSLSVCLLFIVSN